MQLVWFEQAVSVEDMSYSGSTKQLADRCDDIMLLWTEFVHAIRKILCQELVCTLTFGIYWTQSLFF